MKSLLISLILCISFMSLGQAGVLCEKAQLNSLTMGESDNLCLKSDAELTNVETKTLLHLIDLHEQVARLLKVPVAQLFSNPFNVAIREYVFGPFLSSANVFRLNLGVYPGEDFKINSGVYLHELGHVLAASQNPALPFVFEDLDHSVLFSETFADLLALSVHGNIISPDLEKGTCLDRLRYITTFQSYNYPAEYFQSFSEARIRKCCDSLVKTTTEEKYLNLCSAAEDYFSSAIRFGSPFDPTNSKNLDDHQVGLPILSFFKDFGMRTNRPMNEIFEMIFFAKKNSFNTYRCELKKEDELISTHIETLHTAEHMLNDFKETIAEVSLYETLFKKHALEKGITFARLDADKAIKEKLIKKINNQNSVFDACMGKIDLTRKKNCYLDCKLQSI